MDSPWYKSHTFTALLLYVVTMICNVIARKWGMELNATEIAGLTGTVVAFIFGRQYKSGTVLAAEIKAEAVKAAAFVPAPVSPAAALAEAGK